MNNLMTSTATSVPSPRQVAAAFLQPGRPAHGQSLDFLSGGQRLRVPGPTGTLVAAQAGHGPTVALVHGWGGHSSDMAAFAPLLREAGYTVLVPDLPAHGESEGRSASIPQGAQALLALQAVTGPWHAVVAHSVGTAVAVHALGQGLQAGRVVLLAPPARYADYAAGFAHQAGLDPAGTAEMLRHLREGGLDVQAVDTPRTAAQLTQPALVVHSIDDRVVPVRDGEEIAAAWPGAQWLRCAGLGHRRILQAPEVLDATVAFISRG